MVYLRNMELPLPVTDNRKDYIIQRSLEILPGFLTWLTFFLMIFLSIKEPVWVALFIICFDVYWICRGVFIAMHMIHGYGLMKNNISVKWLNRVKGVSKGFDVYYEEKKNEYEQFMEDVKNGKKPKIFQINNNNIIRLSPKVSIRRQKQILKQHLEELEKIDQDPEAKEAMLHWEKVEHVVVIATYKEPVEVLEGNIDAILSNDYPSEKMRIFVSFEETALKAGDDVPGKRKHLEEKYNGRFGHFETTMHPILENEKPGAGSNETWAGRLAQKHLEERGIDINNVMLTSFDAEAYAHKEYFAVITWYFITSKDRTRRAYQPLPFYSNTIWYAPAYSRIISMSSTFWHIVESIREERLVTFSNQSHSFKAIVDADFWPVNYVVNDDSAIYWRCYFKYEGDYKTIPVYIPVSQDAVYVGGFWPTFNASYKQRRRWAYGIEHFPTITRAFLKDKKIKFWEKFKHIFVLIEGNHSWATNPIMIAVLGWLPLVLGGSDFNQQVISKNLPLLTRNLMTMSMIFLSVSVYLGYILVPKRPKNMPRWKNFGFIYQWALTIVMSTILGSVPAVDAQTRLMFGKYMGYDTTPKKRK